MAELEFDGIRYRIDPQVYDPSDDTRLLLRGLRVQAKERFLEVGCGAGLVAIHAARAGARVVAADINPMAVRLTRENARRNAVQIEVVLADLDAGLRWDRLDVVAFNPPYLPTGPDERVPGPLNHAFDGGPGGRTVLDRFLGALAARGPPTAWLVASSLQQPAPDEFPELGQGYRAERVATKRLSHETLTVFRLSRGESGREKE